MSIEPGKYYRRKSDGIKLMALRPCVLSSLEPTRWLFYREHMDRNEFVDMAGVEPWTEPKKKVKLWPALIRSTDGRHFLSNYLWPECPPDAVRLVTEYPAIEVEE